MDILEVRNQIKDCRKCNLWSLMPFKPVPGIGPSNAKIFFLAESPGKDEVILEEPLVGLCGKFFNKLLISAGINREECYISNVIHCRCTDDSKKNRKPKKEEIVACQDWASKEIAAIKPKIVIGFGLHSAEFLYKEKIKRLTDKVGKIEDNGQYKFMCLLHPSYLLQYKQDLTNQTIEYLKQAKNLIKD